MTEHLESILEQFQALTTWGNAAIGIAAGLILRLCWKFVRRGLWLVVAPARLLWRLSRPLPDGKSPDSLEREGRGRAFEPFTSTGRTMTLKWSDEEVDILTLPSGLVVPKELVRDIGLGWTCATLGDAVYYFDSKGAAWKLSPGRKPERVEGVAKAVKRAEKLKPPTDAQHDAWDKLWRKVDDELWTAPKPEGLLNDISSYKWQERPRPETFTVPNPFRSDLTPAEVEEILNPPRPKLPSIQTAPNDTHWTENFHGKGAPVARTSDGLEIGGFTQEQVDAAERAREPRGQHAGQRACQDCGKPIDMSNLRCVSCWAAFRGDRELDHKADALPYASAGNEPRCPKCGGETRENRYSTISPKSRWCNRCERGFSGGPA